MPAMNVNISNLREIEIEKVNRNLPKLIEYEAEYFHYIKPFRGAMKVSGKSCRIPMKMNPGAESRFFDADGGDFGRGSGPDYKEAKFTVREVMTATEFTLKVDWETERKEQAVIQAANDAMMDTAKEHARFINYCLIRDDLGRIGKISAVGAKTDTNTRQVLTFKSSTDGFGVRGIRVKDTYHVYSLNAGALGTDKGTIRCVSVDVNGGTAKFDITGLTTDAAVNDVAVLDGLASGDNPGDPNTFLGTQYHADDADTGTWLGINRADFPQIRANAVDCSGGFTWSAARLAMNKIGNRLGKNAVIGGGSWWCHKSFVDLYESMIQEVIQINMPAGKGPVKGTTDPFFNQSSMAGKPLRWLYEWDRSRVDFQPEGNLIKALIKPTHFIKNEGGKRLFWVVSTDGGRKASKVAYMCSMFQTVAQNPAKMAFLKDLPFTW